MEALAVVGPFIAFLAIYAFLHRRANRGSSSYPVRWGWLAAIIGCAALALLIGALTR
jgi:hypothetical protein